MKTAISLSTTQKNAVDRTANSLHSVFDVDKKRAVDTYDIAKKMGLFSSTQISPNSFIFSKEDLEKVRLNNSLNPDEGRYILANGIAKYVVSSATPASNLNGDIVKLVVDSLTLSLLIPRDEALSIYNYLKSKGFEDSEVFKIVGVKYGVTTENVKKRLNQIIESRSDKNVQEERQQHTVREYK